MHELLVFKVLENFIENPYKEFYLRELAKKLKISPFSAKKYIDLLIKEGILVEDRKANLRYVRANVDVPFKYIKSAFNIRLICKSGFVDFVKNNISNVSSISLFGSMAKGEDDENSDADILVIGKKKHYIDLSHFEKIIKRDINIHFFSWEEWNKNYEANSAFYFDVITYGRAIFGEMPIIKK